LKEKGISAAHYDMRFVKPLDEVLLHEVFTKFDKVITVEDGCLMGGMGSAILEFMVDNGYSSKVVRLGVPDKYIHHGTQKELHAEAGFDTASMIKEAEKLVGVPTKALNEKTGS
jgi:1-deoxy-D-xylulose-5-phosphate synthase